MQAICPVNKTDLKHTWKYNLLLHYRPCARTKYNANREALEKIAENWNEKADARRDASTLVVKLNKMDTVIMTTFWDRVRSRFKATSIHLQQSDMYSATAIDLLQSLTLLCWHTLRAVFWGGRIHSCYQCYFLSIWHLPQMKEKAICGWVLWWRWSNI